MIAAMDSLGDFVGWFFVVVVVFSFVGRIFGCVHRALAGISGPWPEAQRIILYMATGGQQRIIFEQELTDSRLLGLGTFLQFLLSFILKQTGTGTKQNPLSYKNAFWVAKCFNTKLLTRISCSGEKKKCVYN